MWTVDPAIVTALISATACAASVAATMRGFRKDDEQCQSKVEERLSSIDARLAVQAEQIERLSARVDKHNGVIERVYKLEADEATMWHRHDELAERVRDMEQ